MDRKLKPIYDALDARNNKQALKQCDNYLEKKSDKASKDTQLVLTLKALALERLGRREEAEKICRDVFNQFPTDETVLNTLFLTYRSFGKLNEVPIAYENAYKKNPQNEELLNGVFMSYVRLSNYQKMKETAMQLLNTFKNDRYIIWIIMSIYLSAQGPSEKLNLELADRMFDKQLISTNKVKHLESLLFYLDILQRKQELSKIVTVLKGDLGKLFKFENERLQYLADTFIKLKQHSDAFPIFRELIEVHNLDNWAYYLGYFDCGFSLAREQNSLDKFAEESKQFLKLIQGKEGSKGKRGPFLAELELHHRLLKDGKSDLKSIHVQLVAYFKLFGDRSSLFKDLKPYLEDFHGKVENCKALCDELKASTLFPQASDDHKSKDQRAHLSASYFQISRFLGMHSHLSESEKSSLAKEIHQYYLNSLGVPKEATEYAAGDDLLILSSHVLLDLYLTSKEKNKEILYEIAMMLEHGLQNSKYSFTIKIALLHIYHRLNAERSAVEIFNALDVKHILLDTLGYLLLDDVIRNGYLVEAISLCENTQAFHDDNVKQTPEYIVRAFDQGSHSKIKEFIDFKEKLERSHSLNVSRIELVLSHLQKSHSILEYEATLKENSSLKFPYTDEQLTAMSYNDDFTIQVNWESPSHDAISRHYKPTAGRSQSIHRSNKLVTSADTFGVPHDVIVKRLKIRSLLPPLFSALISANFEQMGTYIKVLGESLSVLNLKKEINAIGDSLSFDEHLWTITFHSLSISPIILKAFASEIDSELVKNLQSLSSLLAAFWKRITSNVHSDQEKKIFNSQALPEIALGVGEGLGWFNIVLQVWFRALPSKKKLSTGTASELKNVLKVILTDVKNFATNYLTITAPEALATKVTFDVGKSISVIPSKEENKPILNKVIDNVSNGYADSLARLHKLTEAKLNVLKTLKL